MKTLKQILELYKPKSQDEDKFVRKHIVVKHKDRNGNGDPLFQATNIKAVDRKSERHGYEPGQDEEVYEQAKWRKDPKAHTIQTDDSGMDRKVPKGTNIDDDSLEGGKDPLKHRSMTPYPTPNRQHPSGSGAKINSNSTTRLKKQLKAGISSIRSTPKPNLPEEYEDLEENQDVGSYDGDRGGGGNPPEGGYKTLTQKQIEAERARNKKMRDAIKERRAKADAARARRAAMRKEEYEDDIEDLEEVSQATAVAASIAAGKAARKAKAAGNDELARRKAKQSRTFATYRSPRDQTGKPKVYRGDPNKYGMDEPGREARIKATRAREAKTFARLRKDGILKEEVEYIEEKLKVSDGIHAWIDDFIGSKNRKFDGKSEKERRKMAIGAFYAAKKGN